MTSEIFALLSVSFWMVTSTCFLAAAALVYWVRAIETAPDFLSPLSPYRQRIRPLCPASLFSSATVIFNRSFGMSLSKIFLMSAALRMDAQSTFSGSTFLIGAGAAELEEGAADDAGADDEGDALLLAPALPEAAPVPPAAPLETVTTAVTVRLSPAESDPQPDRSSRAAAEAATTIP